MRDVAEVVRHMGLIRTIRWFYDGYWRAKRDRWHLSAARADSILQFREQEHL